MLLRKSRSAPTGPRPVVALGSSCAEQFDYIFGDNPRYHPFWASGWSARALRGEHPGGYLDTILAGVDRQARVLLVFGPTDVNFNAPHRAADAGIFHLPAFLGEARDGLIHARHLLIQLGFADPVAIFAAPVVELAPGTWERWRLPEQFPALMRARMYAHLAGLVARDMPTLDLVAPLSVAPDIPLLAPAFTRAAPDHHPNYVATQEVIWSALATLPGMLPRRDPPLTELYPHRAGLIKDLKAGMTTRPRTCR